MCKESFLCSVLVAGLAMMAGGMLSGCEEPLVTPDPPTAELSVVTTGTTEAVLNLNTGSISEYAWLVYSEDPGTAPVPDVLFATGTVSACVDGDNEFTVSGLEGNMTYTVYLAAKTIDDEYYSEVLSATFTTTDYTEPLTVVETDYDSFRVHVQVPESVTSAGNALRYLVTDLFTYNMNKNGWMGVTPDADFMASNGGLEYYIDKSQTMTFDNSEEQLYLHNFFVPGSPIVFKVGEFALGESWSGEGYITPLFDYEGFYADPDAIANEANYWTGHHAETVVYLREPALLDADVDVQMDIHIGVKGTITLTPDEEVYQYCVFVLDQATYEYMLSYLDNDESNLQWFVTTENAFMNGALSLSGNQVLQLSDIFYEVPSDSHFHLLITSMGDAEGTSQSFQHLEFDTTPKTLAAPEITVTPIGGDESDDPFTVGFNIKNTGSVPVVSAAYNANYEREWQSLLEYMDYSQILASYGNAFSAAEVEFINSEEGYNVYFNSVDGMATKIAVMGYNEEMTPNVVEEGGSAVAVQSTPYQPAGEKVESALFDELPGDWTMTAEVSQYDYDNGEFTSLALATKVTVYDGINDYPETLPENVYELYPDMSKDEVDVLYEEFKLEAEAFNAKVRGQNRLLCLGFGYEEDSSYPLFSAQTPYELFCNPDYSGYDVASLFYDFGPKWYIEVAADGSVTAPFNSVTMSPLTAWTYNGAYYLAGNNPDAGYLTVKYEYDDDGNAVPVDVAFPVEVSAGGETVSVNPLMLIPEGYEEAQPFYPNAVMESTYGASIGGYRIDSGLTLTKGWNGSEDAASATASVKGGNGSAPALSPMYDVRSASVARPKSRTVVPESAKVKYEEVEIEVLTIDKFNEYLNSRRQSGAR